MSRAIPGVLIYVIGHVCVSLLWYEGFRAPTNPRRTIAHSVWVLAWGLASISRVHRGTIRRENRRRAQCKVSELPTEACNLFKVRIL